MLCSVGALGAQALGRRPGAIVYKGTPEEICQLVINQPPVACSVPAQKILYPPQLTGLGQARVQEIAVEPERREAPPAPEPAAPGVGLRWPFWVGLAALTGGVLLLRQERKRTS